MIHMYLPNMTQTISQGLDLVKLIHLYNDKIVKILMSCFKDIQTSMCIPLILYLLEAINQFYLIFIKHIN